MEVLPLCRLEQGHKVNCMEDLIKELWAEGTGLSRVWLLCSRSPSHWGCSRGSKAEGERTRLERGRSQLAQGRGWPRQPGCQSQPRQPCHMGFCDSRRQEQLHWTGAEGNGTDSSVPQQTEIIDCIWPYTENISYSLLLRCEERHGTGTAFPVLRKVTGAF